MLVRELVTDCKTGETTERMVDIPGVQTLAEAQAADVIAQQAVTNELTIGQQVDAALVANKTFLAITTTTAAQDKAQIKALTRQMNGLIRLVRRKLEAVG